MEQQIRQRKHSGSFWAYFFIIIGVLWLLKLGGWDLNLPTIGDLFSGIGHFIGNLAGWLSIGLLPLILIFLGIMLIIGRRFFGALLLIIVLLILIPHFLIIPGILLILFLPVILIILGIILLSKLF